jgi:hypothetical protein
MKQKVTYAVLPAAFVVVMVMLVSTIFLASATPSFAASGKKKSAAVAKTSAVDSTESRIKQLHSALKITDDQEAVWTSFTQVMRENAKDMDALSKERADNKKTLNAVEHMKFHSQVTEAQLNQQKKLIPAFEALYTSMSDEQKTITDTLFRTGKHGKHKML